MTCVDRYIAKRFLATLFRVVFTLLLLFVLIDLLTHQQENIGEYQVPAGAVVRFYVAHVPLLLFEYQGLALGVLVAGLMVVGRAAQDREITALLAGGVSLWQVLRAPIVLALLLSGAAFAAQETWGASAAEARRDLESRYFLRFDPGGRNGVSWTNLGGGWTCHVLKYNSAAHTGEDVYLHRMGEEVFEEIRARRIYWHPDSRRWLLEDGRWFTFTPGGDGGQEVRRITQVAAPFAMPPRELFALSEPADTKNTVELWQDLQRAEKLGMPLARHWVDFHAKFARPALCFVMIWLAIPFAMRLRRGGMAVGLGVGVALGLAYVVLFFAGIGLGMLGELPPLAAAWLANLVFLALGIYLSSQTPT